VGVASAASNEQRLLLPSSDKVFRSLLEFKVKLHSNDPDNSASLACRDIDQRPASRIVILGRPTATGNPWGSDRSDN
jgi:hypothetical protein